MNYLRNYVRVTCIVITLSVFADWLRPGPRQPITREMWVFANEERLLAIHKELEIARRIQSSILPQTVPALCGLDLATRYAPMSAMAGDFYDFLLVDEKHRGVLIADVTGHGIPAALTASMLKVAFAGQASHAHDPVRVLTGLNLALCGKFEEHFVTAAYLFVDLQDRLLRYSAAGHPRSCWRRAPMELSGKLKRTA